MKLSKIIGSILLCLVAMLQGPTSNAQSVSPDLYKPTVLELSSESKVPANAISDEIAEKLSKQLNILNERVRSAMDKAKAATYHVYASPEVDNATTATYDTPDSQLEVQCVERTSDGHGTNGRTADGHGTNGKSRLCYLQLFNEVTMSNSYDPGSEISASDAIDLLFNMLGEVGTVSRNERVYTSSDNEVRVACRGDAAAGKGTNGRSCRIELFRDLLTPGK